METEYLEEAADMRAKANEIKQHLVDASMVVMKGSVGIVIKISNLGGYL